MTIVNDQSTVLNLNTSFSVNTEISRENCNYRKESNKKQYNEGSNLPSKLRLETMLTEFSNILESKNKVIYDLENTIIQCVPQKSTLYRNLSYCC
jgi:hypothetical protein